MGDAVNRTNYWQFRKIYRVLKDDSVREKSIYVRQSNLYFGVYKTMLSVHIKIYYNLKHYISITFLIIACYNKISYFAFR